MNIPTYEVWEQQATCTNQPSNRYVNYATYKLPIEGFSLVEREYIPFNIFESPKFSTFIDGLILENTKENTKLLSIYGGYFVENPYNELYFDAYFDTLENAYNFFKDNYKTIVENFKANLK